MSALCSCLFQSTSSFGTLSWIGQASRESREMVATSRTCRSGALLLQQSWSHTRRLRKSVPRCSDLSKTTRAKVDAAEGESDGRAVNLTSSCSGTSALQSNSVKFAHWLCCPYVWQIWGQNGSNASEKSCRAFEGRCRRFLRSLSPLGLPPRHCHLMTAQQHFSGSLAEPGNTSRGLASSSSAAASTFSETALGFRASVQ